MKNIFLCIFLFAFLFINSSSLFAAEITISIKYPDGKPAKGIKVREVGLERGNTKNELLGVTDDSGRIKTQIKLEPSADKRKRYLNNPQGSYVYAYRYVIMPDDYRWEVSDIYWSIYPEKYIKDYREGLEGTTASNWTMAKKVSISKNSKINWNVVLEKSPDIRVRLVDQHGIPISKKQVSVFLDLEARTHTGFGGEIDIFKDNTDDKGFITVHNAGNFYYSFDLVLQDHYTTPGLDYSWTVVTAKLTGKDDKVVFHKCTEKQLRVLVKDKNTGQPVSGAYIICSGEMLLGEESGSLGDGAVTDSAGMYETDKFCTEYLTKFGAHKEGYKRNLIDVHKFVPGKLHEFLLEPESKKENAGAGQKTTGEDK